MCGLNADAAPTTHALVSAFGAQMILDALLGINSPSSRISPRFLQVAVKIIEFGSTEACSTTDILRRKSARLGPRLAKPIPRVGKQ